MMLVTLAIAALKLSVTTVESAAVEDVAFESHGVTLSGSVVIPTGAPRAAVVFIQGSGPQSRDLALARRFAAAGIVALVYDKRGAGRSGGEYEGNQSVSEKNLRLLADDASAALDALGKRLSEPGVPIGYAGISQAGWIAPLAAATPGRTRARFLVLWSGPVCKVSEEDIYSLFTGDHDSAQPPGFQRALDSRREPYVWPDFLGEDTDPATSLDALDIPGLWIFGGGDGSIPVDLSIERLQGLIERGHRFEFVRLADLGHNNMGSTLAIATNWILALRSRVADHTGADQRRRPER